MEISAEFFCVNRLIGRRLIKSSHDLVCADRIDKCAFVALLDRMNDLVCFRSGNDGINDAAFLMFIGTLSVHDGSAVVGDLFDHLTDKLRLVGYDKERVLLIFQVKHVQYLSRGILIDDGIERFIPAKENARCTDDEDVDPKNHIPGIHSLFIGQVDSDKIRASGCGVHGKNHTDGCAVDDSAENADEQRVIGNEIRRKDVGQGAGKHDGKAGKPGEFLSDKFESDIDRKGVQKQVHNSIRKLNVKVAVKNALDENSQSSGASRIESSGADKDLNVHSHNE